MLKQTGEDISMPNILTLTVNSGTIILIAKRKAFSDVELRTT
jgi:hypothetical protein